jgi:hypothetical protein
MFAVVASMIGLAVPAPNCGAFADEEQIPIKKAPAALNGANVAKLPGVEIENGDSDDGDRKRKVKKNVKKSRCDDDDDDNGDDYDDNADQKKKGSKYSQ